MDFLHAFGELHVVVLLATVVVILYSDHQGYRYLRGQQSTLSAQFVRRSHRLVWVGLIGMIATGVALTLPAWEYRLSEPAFYVKMWFVLVLLMNGIAIGKLSRVASTTPFSELTPPQQRTLLVSGGLSALGWSGAIVMGLLFL